MANTNSNFFSTSSTTLATSLPMATVAPNVAAPAASTNQPSTLFGSLTSTAPQSSVTFGSIPASTATSFPTSGASSGFLSNLSQTNPSANTLSFSTTPSSSLNQPSLSGVNVSSAAPLLSMQPLKPAQTGISAGIPFTTVSQIATSSTPSSTLNLSFGKASTSAATSTPSTITFGTKLDTPTTRLNVTPAASTSSSFPTLGSTSLNTSTTSTTTNLFGTSSTPTTSATSVSATFMWQKPSVTSTTAPSSIGLGGIDHTAVAANQTPPNTAVSVKEQPLPTEIQQTVVAFKEYVKTQKNFSNEVARSSREPLSKLTRQISSLKNLILTLGSVLSQQKFTAEKIKIETIDALNDYELAQKIKDNPVASEERMLLIRKYFAERISAFEECTKVLQEKIEYVYRHVMTLPQENSLSAEALKIIVKKLHDSFVVISGRAYKLHNDLQLLKVQYLTLRNHYIKDNSSISFSLPREFELPFDTRSRVKLSDDFANVGPNPFSRTGNCSFNSLLFSSQNKQFPSSAAGKEWNLSTLSNVSGSLFGFPELPGNTSYSHNASFGGQQYNLQKSAFSSKRGKR